jgi:hypothetical protein
MHAENIFYTYVDHRAARHGMGGRGGVLEWFLHVLVVKCVTVTPHKSA